MKKYGNASGKSGVVAYELLPDGIRVKFRSGDVYLYTSRSAGYEAISAMHELAAKGKGLSTYISQVVKERYED